MLEMSQKLKLLVRNAHWHCCAKYGRLIFFYEVIFVCYIYELFQ